MSAAPGASAAVMIGHEGPVHVTNLRISLSRTQGPVNVQLGLFGGNSLLVGVMSTLESGEYFTAAQSDGVSSADMRCGWQQGASQQLDLSYIAGQWVLRDVNQNAEVKVAGRDNLVDRIQLVIPAARQGQTLGVNSLSISGE